MDSAHVENDLVNVLFTEKQIQDRLEELDLPDAMDLAATLAEQDGLDLRRADDDAQNRRGVRVELLHDRRLGRLRQVRDELSAMEHVLGFRHRSGRRR